MLECPDSLQLCDTSTSIKSKEHRTQNVLNEETQHREVIPLGLFCINSFTLQSSDSGSEVLVGCLCLDELFLKPLEAFVFVTLALPHCFIVEPLCAFLSTE